MRKSRELRDIQKVKAFLDNLIGNENGKVDS